MPGSDADPSRHPAAGRWRADLPRMASRMAGRLAADGAAWPEVAAAALAARAPTGLDQAAFASALGLEVAAVAAVEAGAVAPEAVPPALAQRMAAGPAPVSAVALATRRERQR